MARGAAQRSQCVSRNACVVGNPRSQNRTACCASDLVVLSSELSAASRDLVTNSNCCKRPTSKSGEIEGYDYVRIHA